MKKEEAEFIVETLETAIEWAEYATLYFQMKHTLDVYKEDVQKAIKLMRDFESITCENCKFYQPETITVGDIITCGRWEQENDTK